MTKDKTLSEKRETLVMRIEKGLKEKIDNLNQELRKKTGYRISMSNFVEVAIKEKLERELNKSSERSFLNENK